ncbi:MAG TPA: NHLP leader peptide family RiPP precursor [Chloroflexia bacterium]|nr:NHLP leader peptide family RiPP precursor [Chloroflexia bacterium]
MPTPEGETWREFQARILAKAADNELYRHELLTNPKAVLERELDRIHPGARLPLTLQVRAVEETTDLVYLVLPPRRTVGADGALEDYELEAVAGGQGWAIGGDAPVWYIGGDSPAAAIGGDAPQWSIGGDGPAAK